MSHIWMSDVAHRVWMSHDTCEWIRQVYTHFWFSTLMCHRLILKVGLTKW